MDSRLQHPPKIIIVNQSAIDLNEANFDQEVLHATQPVLVGFWAGWSDPCKTMTPRLASAAEGPAVPVNVARVKVEHHKKLTEQYGVRAMRERLELWG